MFQLLYDSAHNVLLTRLSGVYCEQDIVLRDKQVAGFVARNGLSRGLMDFTAVTAVDIPMDVIVRRAHAPPLLPGQARVIVASNEPSYSLNRVVAAHQYFSRKVEPLLVGSMRAAYHALGATRFDFVLVQDDEQLRRDRIAFAAFAEIDAGARRQVDRYRRLAAASRRRMAEPQASTVTVPHARSLITASDVFNTALRHARLTDRDLSVHCPRCGREMALAACSIRVRRQTTYSCPACTARLLTLKPGRGAPIAEGPGYSFGSFNVETYVDIRCHGVVLPKSR